jgi:cation:H+ antiporter
MLLTVIMLVVGIAFLTAGAEFFVRGSSLLAARIGISPLVIGLTVVSFGTSAPELFVSVKSAFDGFSGITLGNVIGSNIANVALILGVSALICPLKVQRQVVRRDTPFMILFSAITVGLLFNRVLSRPESIFLLVLFFAYVVFTVILAIKEKTQPDEEIVDDRKKYPLPLLLLFIVGGMTALVSGANQLVTSGVALARFFGVSDTIIGISVIAVGTSLPELAASAMAAYKKEADIAIGNIVGSNVFNIGLVLGTAGTISPLSVPDLKIMDLGLMLLFSVMLFPFIRTGFILSRIEGALFLAGYGIYIFFLWM